MTGRVDLDAARRAQGLQGIREDADYDARPVSRQEAEDAVAAADGFIVAVEEAL